MTEFAKWMKVAAAMVNDIPGFDFEDRSQIQDAQEIIADALMKAYASGKFDAESAYKPVLSDLVDRFEHALQATYATKADRADIRKARKLLEG